MKTKLPKIKKVKIGALKKKIQIEFNHLIASGKPCAKCGQTFPVMQASHCRSIGAAPNLRFDPMNVLPMCGHCHPYWWHLEPSESWSWFEQKYPGRVIYIEKAQNKQVDWSIPMLLEIRQKVKDGDLRGLLIAPELLLDSPVL
jgi:hypothetical protein